MADEEQTRRSRTDTADHVIDLVAGLATVRADVQHLKSMGGEIEETRSIRDEVTSKLSEGFGADMDGGIVGEIRKDMDSNQSLLRWVLCFAITSAGAAAATMWRSGEAVGRFESDIQTLKEEVRALRSLREQPSNEGNHHVETEP